MNAVLRPLPAPRQRPMVAADLDAVLAIEVAAYPFPWSRGNFIDSLAAGYHAELRFDSDGTLVGYFVALPGFEETHLLNLTVAPPRQRRGHGRAMLERLAGWAQARGDRALWLEVRQSNLGARSLYQRQGFAEVGCRRGYYPAARQQREDAVVMRRELNAEADRGDALD
ncbi:MAG: ribosomal protein S18-alanine N-acetyltransferase [Burkholderiaceae bacterium]|nr:ribosomal protein S18-alanine N-acetyltransferase [Burkholderiaceae bacterium]